MLKTGRGSLSHPWPSVQQHEDTRWGALDTVSPASLTSGVQPASPESELVWGEPGPDSPGNLFWAASSQGYTARPPPRSVTLRPILLKAVLNPEDVHGNIHPSFFSSQFNSYSKLTHLTNIQEFLMSILPVLTPNSDGVDSNEHTTTKEGFFYVNKIKQMLLI